MSNHDSFWRGNQFGGNPHFAHGMLYWWFCSNLLPAMWPNVAFQTPILFHWNEPHGSQWKSLVLKAPSYIGFTPKTVWTAGQHTSHLTWRRKSVRNKLHKLNKLRSRLGFSTDFDGRVNMMTLELRWWKCTFMIITIKPQFTFICVWYCGFVSFFL